MSGQCKPDGQRIMSLQVSNTHRIVWTVVSNTKTLMVALHRKLHQIRKLSPVVFIEMAGHKSVFLNYGLEMMNETTRHMYYLSVGL